MNTIQDTLSCTIHPFQAHTATRKDVLDALGQRNFERATALLADLTKDELNAVDQAGWTLLHHGVAYRDTAFVAAVLERLDHLTICKENKTGLSALTMAVELPEPALVHTIAPFFGVDNLVDYGHLCDSSNQPYPNEYDRARLALAEEIRAAVQRIVETARDSRALLACAASRQWHLVQELAQELSADELAAVDRRGNTALHIALREAQEVVAIQLAGQMNPLDLIKENHFRQTPIDLAAYCELYECTELMFERLAPLFEHLAPQCLLPYQILVLATVIPKNQFAWLQIEKLPPLSYVPPTESKEQLQSLSADAIQDTTEFEQFRLRLVHSAMVAAAAGAWSDAALALMDKLPDECLNWIGEYPSFDPLDESYKSKTLLQAAARTGCTEVVQALVARLGPDCLQARFKGGENALHIAARSEQKETCAVLLECAAEKLLQETDENGMTPLHLACSNLRSSQGIPSLLVEPMQQKDLATLDNKNHTPLEYLFRFWRIDGTPAESVADCLIRHMQPEDLRGRCLNHRSYLHAAFSRRSLSVALALRECMYPSDYAALCEELLPQAKDEDWRQVLTPMATIKPAED
ncbi:MAG: ankyrin repeat domain-containing protein [Chlamydiia bacterium]|nr:ankyrin repeat domain-containing protein [Chlamydiia bacterium]